MMPDIFPVTETSPPRYFLQGLESDDSSEGEEEGLSLKDCEKLQDTSLRTKLVISFKNPFKRGELIKQNLLPTSCEVRDNVAHFLFEPHGEIFYFSRGHAARWSKIEFPLINSTGASKIVEVFREYVPSTTTLSCISLNGHLELSLRALNHLEKRAITPRVARRLNFDESSSTTSLSLYPPSPEKQTTHEKHAQLGFITKVISAYLRIPLNETIPKIEETHSIQEKPD
jgi:hypothetical protein